MLILESNFCQLTRSIDYDDLDEPIVWEFAVFSGTVEGAFADVLLAGDASNCIEVTDTSTPGVNLAITVS